MIKGTVEIREAVIEQAISWLRTPFRHQAQVKDAGVGCGTFLMAAYNEAGVPTPDLKELSDFAPDWHLHEREERYLHILLEYSHPVEVPQPGDIALFRFGRVFGHSAIVVNWPMVIHVMWERTVEYSDASKAPLAGKKVIFLSPFGGETNGS